MKLVIEIPDAPDWAVRLDPDAVVTRVTIARPGSRHHGAAVRLECHAGRGGSFPMRRVFERVYKPGEVTAKVTSRPQP